MKTVRNIRDLVEAFGGDRAFGLAIYGDTSDPWRSARNAKSRGAIAVARWDATIRRARARGITVTLEQLASWTRAIAGTQHR